MFVYTPSQEILVKFDSITKNSKKPWDDHYFLGVHVAGTTAAYFAVGGFWKNYKGTQFYSEEKRKTVPVNGTLIRVEFFEETKLK